jgi:hypothetical protein
VQSGGRCKGCEHGAPEYLVSVGETVDKASALAPGCDRIRFMFHQCIVCGSVWMTYREVGPGREDGARLCVTRGWI